MLRSSFSLLLLMLLAAQVANAQWTQVPGKETHWCLALYTINDTLVAATQDSNILRSIDHGATWVHSSDGIQDSLYTNAMYGEGRNIYLGSDKGSYISTDAGQTWRKTNAGLLGSQAVYAFYRAGSYLFMGGDSGVFRSLDNGQSWQAANFGIPEHTLVRSFAADDVFLYTGTSHQGIFRSSDGGEHWELRSTAAFVNSVVRTLWAGEGYILAFDRGGRWFRSTDRGATWATKLNNLTPGADQAFSANLYQHSIICGANEGVIRSDDFGASWLDISTGMPSLFRAFSTTMDGEIMYAAGFNNWIWRRPLSEILPPAGVADAVSPYAIRLYQNNPNPTSSVASISYTLPSSVRVNLKVYNAMMQEVSTLVNESQEAGEHTVAIDASSLPSGVYYYMLNAGKSTLTRRMVVMK